MRKLLCAILVLVLLVVPVVLSVSAESAVDEDVILSDLIPLDDSSFTLTDCEVEFNRDGSFTVRVTGAASPTVKITLAEGATLYTGAAVDLSDTATNPAYVAVDFGTAGSVQFTHMILHYTRKDKTAQNTVADLYLNSMYDAQYASYRKQVDEVGYTAGTLLANGSSHYVVWDWGTYISGGDGKLNDDGRHHFTDIEINLTGSAVGSEVTFYTIAVVSDPDVELGKVAPDPIEDEPSEDEPSEDEPSVDEPDESSAVSEETSSEEETSSAAPSAATSSEASAATSSTTAGTSSAADTSSAAEGGLSTGAIIGIIVAVVAVIVIVVVVVVVRKKK